MIKSFINFRKQTINLVKSTTSVKNSSYFQLLCTSESENQNVYNENYVRLKGNTFEVQLPSGMMNHIQLSPKEQKMIDFKEASQNNNSSTNTTCTSSSIVLSDLDILREQMRLLLERMS